MSSIFCIGVAVYVSIATDFSKLDPKDRTTCLQWSTTAREAYKQPVLENCIRKFTHEYEVRK
jgi:hypothetical protein